MNRSLRRGLMGFLLVWLGVCLVGEMWDGMHPRPFTPLATPPAETVVQLRCATLPSVLRVLAVHHWFVVSDLEGGRWQRWEVWQDRDAGGMSWGHVHRDLMSPDGNVGGGPYQVLHEWRGPPAQALSRVLADPLRYPDHDRYLAWPGPNSNTYIAWVLREAGVAADLHPLAIGKDYLGLAGAAGSPTRTGVQIETPVLGVKVGLRDGIELHLLCLTAGIDVWPPACKTPLGRLGFREWE